MFKLIFLENKKLYIFSIKKYYLFNYMKLFFLFFFLLVLLSEFFNKYYDSYLKGFKKHIIHIAMSLNNNYTYPIMVSLSSILLNSKKTTFINFHFLIGDDVTVENINKISSLKYLNNNSNYSFYNVKDNFKGWKTDRKGMPEASFYRILLPNIIKSLDKIIYLDGDTLTYGDLTEMYNLNMSNLFFRGLREIAYEEEANYTNLSRYICSGVMLMNLKMLRENHALEQFTNYYHFLANRGLSTNDQNIINKIFTDKIGFLPPKYGIFQMRKSYMKRYKKIKPRVYNKLQLIKDNKKPIIRHIFGKLPVKPWLIKGNYKIKNVWNYYANKTGYYSLICEYFKNACVNISVININLQ